MIANYIIKRVMLLIPLLLGITFVSFMLLKALPGDITLSLVGERADKEIIENIRKELGADKDVLHQYAGYLGMLARGDFGRSYYTGRDVLQDISMKFPNTMKLAVAAMAIALPLGIVMGYTAAFRKRGVVKKLIDTISLAGLSIPVFWSAIIIMIIFSLGLKLFPPSGSGHLKFLVLPACTLSIPAAATLVRVTRASVGEVLYMPFVTTARAKGLTGYRLHIHHVLKNAIIPIITIVGLDFGSYLNGAVVTETIFGWDGIGRFAMEGIIKRDYPVIMGCIIAGTFVFVIVNLLTDVFYHYLDPRIRLNATEK
jgi:peptide/nickel transport system permease protein